MRKRIAMIVLMVFSSTALLFTGTAAAQDPCVILGHQVCR